jgi:putative flippase GtrA
MPALMPSSTRSPVAPTAAAAGSKLATKYLAAFATWFRASIAGGIATASDLCVLFTLTAGFGLSPHVANVPALLVGGTVNFFVNRHFAFRAKAGSVKRQAALYIAVEALALLLNGFVYDLLLRVSPMAREHYGVVRVAAGAVVFLLWSYPLWRWVFKTPAQPQKSQDAVTEGGGMVLPAS